MNLHPAMSVFVEVAKTGGFAEAARKLGMSTTAVSRQVGNLEKELGVTLLRRTTRHVSPTEAGACYLPRAAAILDEVASLNAEISSSDAAPRGRSEEHTSELQSLMRISYAVFCLKKKNKNKTTTT